MTQTQIGSGFPGEQVTVVVRNDFPGPAFSPWVVTAPPGTSILTASGSAASGSATFGCTGSGASVSCGPSNAGGWAANNLVTIVLQIGPGAAAGDVTGTTAISGGESGTYTVTVLPPPSPSITAPLTGTRTLDPAPPISGTKRAGNAATALVDGVPACSVPADTTTTWICTPTPLPTGLHTLTATQTSPAGDESGPAQSVTVEVLEPAALGLAHDGPAAAVPTVAVTRSITVTNNGPGTAEAVSATFDLGGFPAMTCTVAGAATDCGDLSTGVILGDLVPGEQTALTFTGTVPADTPEGTTFSFVAEVSSVNDAASPVAASGSLMVAAPAPPAIATPTAGSSTTTTSPPIAGTGIPSAMIVVTAGSTVVCRTVVAADGTWSCIPPRPFALGAVALRATQALGGLTSGASPVRSFTIVAPPAPRPTPIPPRTAQPPLAPSGEPAPPATQPMPPAVTEPAPALLRPRALRLDLRFGITALTPGTVSAMRGTLGPNTSDIATQITLRGTVGKGFLYRSVILDPDGECFLSSTAFSCTITLQPGDSAMIEIRLYTDPLNAPDTVRQQFTVSSSLSDQDNSSTSTVSVARDRDSETPIAVFSLDMTKFPGAFLPLLALLLFALAAAVAERTRRTPPPTATPLEPRA